MYRNVAFYRAAFDEHRVNLEEIDDIRRLSRLPFTTREDLCRAYPYDMFAVPLKDIVRIHSISTMTGRPVVVGYTRNDLRNWTECTARLLAAAGVTEHDVVQIALDYSFSAGAFGFHQGAEQIGASVIPAWPAASVEKQLVVMRDFKTTALVATPAQAVNLAAGMAQSHVHAGQLHLKLGLFGGERWGEHTRRQLEEQFGIVAMDTYGLADVLGPGVAGECSQRRGLHINEDHFIVEVIHPRTLEPLEAGQKGELVFTTITKEGFPLVRYRTGDIASIDETPCACGRMFARMSRVSGRTDDLIQFHGVGFFPSQIEGILFDAGCARPHYQIVLERENGVDTLEVRIEVSDQMKFLDDPRALGALRIQVAEKIKSTLDVQAKVSFAEPKSLRQGAEAGMTVLDRRPE